MWSVFQSRAVGSLGCALGFASILLAAPAAKAATLSESQNFSVSATADGTGPGAPPYDPFDNDATAHDDATLTFSKFNLPGALLQSVQIGFTSEYGGAAILTITNGGGTFFNAGTATMMLSSPLAIAPAQLVDGASTSCFSTFACSNSATYGGVFDGALTPMPVGNFVGAGFFDVFVDLDIFMTDGIHFEPHAFATLSDEWTGEVTVTYDYQVPEPLSAGLVGFALLGFRALRRRKTAR